MDTYNSLGDWIRAENEGQPSTEDQVVVGRWFFDHGITVIDDKVAKTSTVEENVDHRIGHETRTCLDNLEDIEVLVETELPGNDTYIRNHRTGENFFNPPALEFVPLLDEEISRLVDDLRSREREPVQVADGGTDESEAEAEPTLREVAAEALDTEESDVEAALTDPDDPFERMERFDPVVKAIKDNESVSRKRNYDAMGWRNKALRWSLSQRAAQMESDQSITSTGDAS